MASVQENAKQEPDLSYLLNLRPAISTMYLMNTCIRTVLIPLATANVTIRRDMEKTSTAAIDGMEEKVNSIMQRSIDVVLVWVTKLLTRQQKSDFRPKDDALSGGGAWLEQLQTSTCMAIFTFMSKFHNLALTALSPSPNLTTFLTELAVNFRTQLLEHFKKFSVNAAGGIMVTKDISKYIELLRSWELDPSFDPSFEVLTEIGNIFVIGPDALKERLRGKGIMGGGAWEKSDLRAYVLRREDVGSVGVQSALSAL